MFVPSDIIIAHPPGVAEHSPDHTDLLFRRLDQSRKRGTLESELLMSTFASANLASMSKAQLGEYDIFLDENDWDIYYWATQEPTPTSLETAEGAVDMSPAADIPVQSPRPGEWAQTVGTFKPAYRPVPQRWKKSEILARLRDHVNNRRNEGMAFMPPITHFN
jgi:succinate dehydrogenase flavin-adding protein (antitoxin of CptAB toxin-antitoxin module)